MRGFSLIELLVVLGLSVILVSIALFSLGAYSLYALRIQVISDMRNCIGHIAVSRQTGQDISLQQIVSQCPKSPNTESIDVVSENPILLQAKGKNKIGKVSCTYSESTGKVLCDSPF